MSKLKSWKEQLEEELWNERLLESKRTCYIELSILDFRKLLYIIGFCKNSRIAI